MWEGGTTRGRDECEWKYIARGIHVKEGEATIEVLEWEGLGGKQGGKKREIVGDVRSGVRGREGRVLHKRKMKAIQRRGQGGDGEEVWVRNRERGGRYTG